MVEPVGGMQDQPQIFCKCSQSVTDNNLHQHMATCEHLRE